MTTAPEEFNPSRLSLARRRRGLTKARLATELGIEARSVSGYENGEFKPEPERLDAIAKVLQFPVTFFFGEDLEIPTPEATSFRSLARMAAADRHAALGAGAIALVLNRWIDARFELPLPSVPDLREKSPEGSAEALRRMWGLGELPIRNMVHLLESKGVRIFSLCINAVEVDAFSMWNGDTPFVFLNTRKSSERSRFDAAHELGHLVLHRHGSPQGQEAEREADAFASAFLMPRGSVLAKTPRFVDVDTLVKIKAYWTVSVAALAHRLHLLGIITDWHHRSICIEIAQRGYRKKEPEEAPRESSQVLAKVFAALRAEGVAKADVAAVLQITEHEVDQLVFGLVLTGLPGSIHRQVKTKPASGQTTLRLVKGRT